MTVYLVGAGPGDPDLLTVRAARLLAAAEVVVHDRVIPPALLALVPEGVLRIDVGKGPGHLLAQEHINDLLIDLGARHHTVVRLKVGDPLVFGRGGEEMAALHAAGVPAEVVPGVSTAMAVPASCGIPVTHRGIAAAVTVVSGHRVEGTEPVDWRALARVGGTLVVLMGAAHAQTIATDLLAGGLEPSTPVAAIRQRRAGAPEQHRLTLGALAADGAPLGPPVTLVIGAVAALSLRPCGAVDGPVGDVAST